MSREDSNKSIQSSLDSEVSNHNDDETSSITPLQSFKNECISKITQLLHLDNSDDSEILANQLMIKGRQALQDHKQDVSKEVFEKQMNTNQSELLEILKTYVEQQWKETITEKWFHQFLLQEASQSTAIYNRVLTTTAEYGSTYIKDNALLSLTIQFLFEFDNETIDLWSTETDWFSVRHLFLNYT